MKKCIGILIGAAAFSAFLFATPTSMAQTHMTSGTMNMNMPGHNAHGEMQAAMEKMDAGMQAAPMSGNPDHDFASMMIPHHQGAIEMAKVELKHGKDVRLRKLAQSIIEAQEREIKEMKDMLTKMDASEPAKAEKLSTAKHHQD